PRLAPVLDDRKAVRTQVAELHAVPDLVVDRAVPTEAAAHERRLPACLIIGQEVRGISGRIRLAVDAARAEALRPGRIEHQSLARLPLRIHAINVAAALAAPGNSLAVHDLRDVVARYVGPAVALRERAVGIVADLQAVDGQATILARAEPARIPEAKSRESIERVIEPIEAQTAGERHRVGDVPIGFAEHCPVLVFALLVGDPDRTGIAGDRQVRRQV